MGEGWRERRSGISILCFGIVLLVNVRRGISVVLLSTLNELRCIFHMHDANARPNAICESR